ncbi:MAG: hypothetical protein M3094_02680 [Actinomycetia bacterium]|nr:hypothetical protein [Actinomycetes bacterium]
MTECDSCGLREATIHADDEQTGRVFYLCEGCCPADDEGFVVTELEDTERYIDPTAPF